MAQYDSSFNAQGPTVVGFECIDFGPRAFGAGVNGSQCGVHGEGMATPQGSRSVNVTGTGVHGRGDLHGVYGTDGSIPSDQEPNLGADLPDGTKVPIGVVGVTTGPDTKGGGPLGPAVLGDQGILQTDISLMPKNPGGLTQMDCARELAAGVEGVSKEGYGVVGIAFKGGLTTDLNIPTVLGLGGTIQLESGPSGVAGFSVKGPGVMGISHTDRGGLFVSNSSAYPVGSPVAQIRLVPHFLKSDADLPNDGRTGDLLVTINVDGTCALWLCVRSLPDGTTGTGCSWAPVQLGPEITLP